MPGPALTFPMQLDPTVRKELEAFLAQLNEGFLYVEHNEDGTHGDITAHSIIVSGTDVGDAVFSGPLEVAQWIDITPIDTATSDAQNSANNKGWTEPRILLGLVRGPNINPATDVGIRLRGTAPTALIQPDYTISAGYDSFDALTALVVTHMDTSQSAAAVNIPLKIGFNAGLTSKFNILPDQRTESVDGVSLGAVDFGFGSNFHGFTNILGRTIYAGTPAGAIIIGSPDTNGVRLELDTLSYPGSLAVREGDDSDWNDIMCRRLVSQSGFVESTTGDYYLGQGIVGDILLKKNGTGAMLVRLGDNSDYGDIICRGLGLTTNISAPIVIASSYLVIGTADTNGARLKADATFLYVREGDDSAYTGLAAGTIISTSGYVQSASSYYYLGSGISSDILFRKTGTGIAAIRLGDDSGFGSLEVAGLNATQFIQSSAGPIYFGPTSTSGAILRLSSGTPVLREGDDSDYNDLILRDLGAVNITATGTVTAAAFSGPFSGAVSLPDGSAGSPSLTFTNDTDTGLFRAGSGALAISLNAQQAMTAQVAAGFAGHQFTFHGGAFGDGVQGSSILVGRNTSNSSAAGTVGLQRRDGTFQYLWSDDTGLIRTNPTDPPDENDIVSHTGGTVVGDQSSSRAFKDIIAERTDYETALGVILDTPVYDFTYKDGRYQGQTFTGIVAEESPIFAKDAGRSFNELTFAGIAILAMKAQQTQIEDLKRDIEELKAVIRKWA